MTSSAKHFTTGIDFEFISSIMQQNEGEKDHARDA